LGRQVLQLRLARSRWFGLIDTCSCIPNRHHLRGRLITRATVPDEMRPLPDPNLSLRDASDFIFESELCRRALLNPEPKSLAVFLRDLLAEIHRLTLSCNLPEFTDHGLQH